LFFAFLTFLASLIPVIGASTVWVPFVIYLFVGQQVLKAVILLLIGIFVISMSDNILKPLVIGKKTKMPLFLLFLGILGGLQAYGITGIFLSGLVVGIIAAPCIGPPIVALLAMVGQSGNPLKGFIVFFVLSLGLGLPYLVLGTFSGMLKKLPRSGTWMIWVKKVFGFLLLGVSLFYFSLALYPDLVPHVVPITLIAGALYLGFIDRTGSDNPKFKTLKRTGAALVLGGVFLGFVAQPEAHVTWEPYEASKLELAKAEGKPVVVNVSADWCIPCHELDRYTFTDPRVIKALEPFVKLKADATNPNTEEAMEPLERFRAIGVPTIIFLDEAGEEIEDSRIVGYVPPEIFLESIKMEKGALKDAAK